MLDITARPAGDITILDLTGSLVSGLGLEQLRPRIDQLVAEKKVNVVLNAHGVSVIDSAGVGELVGCFSTLKRNGGTLKILNPSKFVQDILRITKLPTIIEVHDTEDAALKSFGK
jgi:anti-sigma B factor antagonist